MTWLLILILITFISIYIFRFIKKEKEVSFVSAFLIFGYICYFFGYILIFFMFELKGKFREIYNPQELLTSLLVSIYFFVLVIILYNFIKYLFCKYRKKKYVEYRFVKNRFIFYKVLSILMISISFLSISYFVYLNKGFILLNNGNYDDRYAMNAGLGFIRIFFTLYIPGYILLFLLNPTKKKYIIYLIYVVLFGLYIYMAMGGMRNVLFSGILAMLFLGINLKYISYRQFILTIPFGLILLTSLAIFRYSSEFKLDNELLYLSLNYTIDSISPIYSLHTILYNVPENYSYVGFDYFFNQFLSFIPRSLWDNKPLILNTNAYIYTKEILNYFRDLIISPTSIGVFFMMGGYIGITLGAISFTLLFYFLNLLKSSTNLFKNSIFYYFLPLTFWTGRGSFEYFIYNLILLTTVLFFIYLISIVIYTIFFKDYKINRPKKRMNK